MARYRAVGATALTALLLGAPAAAAQSRAGDLAFGAGNAALGGLTAGVARKLDGGAFWPAFRDGALGGAVAYAGRRVAVARFDGAGFLGRELASVGGAVVANAADGRGRFARLTLPIGFIRLDANLDARAREACSFWLSPSLDLPTFVATLYYVVRDDVEVDADASLSAGTPVFHSFDRRADGNWRGEQLAGVIRVLGNPGDPLPDHARRDVLAHELVHVLQYDFGQAAWSAPVEAWLLERVPARVGCHVDLGLHLLPWALANLLVPYEQRPWEHEANFLSGVRADRD